MKEFTTNEHGNIHGFARIALRTSETSVCIRVLFASFVVNRIRALSVKMQL